MANTTHGVTIHPSTSGIDESYVNRCVAAFVAGSYNLDNMLSQLNKAERAEYEVRTSEVHAQKLVEDVRRDAQTAHNILASIIGEA